MVEIKDEKKANFYQISNKFLDVVRNPYCIAVYNCLIFFSTHKKTYPSIEVLAYKCGISHPTVNKALKILEEKNLIKVVRRNKQGKKRTNVGNIYFINEISNH